MKKIILSIVIFIVLLFFALLCYAQNEIMEDKPTMVTDTYIFSLTHDENFFGEGFFCTLQSGNEIFIYSKSQDNPHDIANTRRKIHAIIKGAGSFNYSTPQTMDAYLATKYDLGAENRLLPENYYKILADETIKRGLHKNITMVYYRVLNFSENELKFTCNEITSIDGVTMTTGGSVYLFTINRKDGESLNILIDATFNNASQQLSNFMQEIQSLVGSDAIITTKDVQFQSVIYTRDGVRSGWTTFKDSVILSEAYKTE